MIVPLQQPPDRKRSPPNLAERKHTNLPSKRRCGLSSNLGTDAVFMRMKPSLNWLLIFVPLHSRFAFFYLPEPFARQLTTTCGIQAFLPVRPMECTPLSEKAKRAYELRAAAGCKPGRLHRPQACIPPDSYRWSRIM